MTDISNLHEISCKACGITLAAGCGCRVGYDYVKPIERAKRAIANTPDKSDRAIAEDIGVSDTTVLRARRTTASKEAVEKRTGKDGKARRQPKKSMTAKRPTKTWIRFHDDIGDYIRRLDRWLIKEPALESDHALELVNVLLIASDELKRLAQTVKGLEICERRIANG
jgi:hypothetical protein